MLEARQKQGIHNHYKVTDASMIKKEQIKRITSS
jgi:hypothetical protein